MKKPTLLKSIPLLLLMLMGLFFQVNGQKNYYVEEEEVVKAAYAELESSMKEGALKKFAEKYKITGSYTMDITLKNKGEVASVKTIERDGEIADQNALKDFIIEYKFPFKMPKNKSYKFQYEFKF